ncbi:hypothetical protein [Zobellella iuensis]|uniref:Uncharacterized protein n=1 Tax=Zobellella iuensis TaxID=2803811 RepID=A0ABS1QWC1_9GAMM|nr:hypothetical protein [Zobellella iuensis]MBL1379185.1 hypothetical protein [Zobellella iuensis]
MSEHPHYAQGAFTIELTVFNRWPFRLGPFHTGASEGELVAELAALLDGLPCRLDGLDCYDHTEVLQAEYLAPWRGRDTLLAHGLRAKPWGEPFVPADLPLLRGLLAHRYHEHYQGALPGERAGLPMDPDTLRLAMQDHIEGTLVAALGREQGEQQALALYLGMMGASGLSPVALEVLDALLAELAETAHGHLPAIESGRSRAVLH